MAMAAIFREQLERELLLSKGGGIYYDAARVDADENTAVLFIGLGGTGADMLIRIKNEVKRRMVLPKFNGKIISDTPLNIGFLAMDTSEESKSKTWGIASFDEFGDEFCPLMVDNMPRVAAECKRAAESGDPIWSWYDGMDSVLALDGAGGYRQIGRLMLFKNADRVYAKVKNKIQSLVTTGITRVMIFIAAGIAGGTGSGTIIDMAYIVRKAADELQVRNTRVFGYAVMPDVSLLNGGFRERLWANGFACLKEIDYWMCPGENEQNDRFVCQYTPNLRVDMINSRVFDYCHLLSAQDMEGHPLSYNNVISSMAENIFAYVAGETSDQTTGNSTMSSMYDNIDNYMVYLSTTAPHPACYRYLAVGTHKLEIPYEEISTLLAIRLFERLAPTFALRPTKESWESDLAYVWLSENMAIHESMTSSVAGSKIKDTPPSPFVTEKYRFDQIWGGANVGAKSNRVYEDVDSVWLPDYQAVITHNHAIYVEEIIGRFKGFLKEKIADLKKGPMYLAHFTANVLKELTRYAEHCDAVAATCVAEREKLDRELETTYEAGAKKIVFRQKSVDAYVHALENYVYNNNSIRIYTFRAERLRELRDRLEVIYKGVMVRLCDILEVLPEIFATNFEYIRLAQKEAVEKNRLDDTRLIWPLKFEEENYKEFQELLEAGMSSFLEGLRNNVSKWIGSDFDNPEATEATDVPGEVSRFISQQFGSLLSINMEDIMRAKLGGASTSDLDNYLHRKLNELRDKSVPMFSLRSEVSSSTAEFAIVSVPDDCLNIKAAANKYLSNDKIKVKISKEKTRLYLVKVVSGVALYQYAHMEEAERIYEESMLTETTQKGVHLCGEWARRFPSPIAESAWTPGGIYVNERVKKYNHRARSAFDACMKNEIFRPDNPDMPTKYFLSTADVPSDYFDKMILEGSVGEKLGVLSDELNHLWKDSKSIEFAAMGRIGGFTLEQNIRENTLRFPYKCDLVMKQASILESYNDKRRQVESPQFFAYALVCGLVVDTGHEKVLKSEPTAVRYQTLYDKEADLPFADYHAFTAFVELLDQRRCDDIANFYREMLRRDDIKERIQVRQRAEEAIALFEGEISNANTRMSGLQQDRRDKMKKIIAFYQDTVSSLNKTLANVRVD